MIKYFFKVIKSENIIIKTIYKTMLNDMSVGKANWVSRVKTLLEENVFYMFGRILKELILIIL